MSDDTPTQRFDQSGEDAPTEILRMPASAEEPGTAPESQRERTSRRTIIILASVGGALLIALIILLIVLLTRGDSPGPVPTDSPTPTPSVSSASPTPTATSATPSPTPTPTPTPPPPPPPSNDATVDAFAIAPDSVTCDSDGSNVELDISWETSNADQIYFGIDTTDASAAPFFSNLPPNGDSSDFPAGYFPFEYSCPAPGHTYTITAVNDDGSKDSWSIEIDNDGYTG